MFGGPRRARECRCEPKGATGGLPGGMMGPSVSPEHRHQNPLCSPQGVLGGSRGLYGVLLVVSG